MSQINEDSKKPTKDRLNPIVFYGSAVTIVLFSLWTIIFTDQMHYSFVKTNTFNGTPLANLAVRWEDGIIESLSDFGYEEFRRRLGR